MKNHLFTNEQIQAMRDAENIRKKARREAEKEEKKAFKDSHKGMKCSNCAHGLKHPFSDKYFYCKKGRSQKTRNGFATTKRSGWCNQWGLRDK